MEKITAKGFNGTATFDGTTVTIDRKGAGMVALPVQAIKSVEYKKGGLTVGYLKLHTGAALDNRKTRNKTQALLTDPHAVTLQWTSNKQFEPLVEALQAAISANA
ncbi:hypothetical protein SEA_LITTLETOKYO_25 [Arthrobacter phage LittleTokyo]|nr:hypothetical protein SEA_LITTLETOKYO_25 [Arthrobacter phage LittleTokyo]